MMGNSTSTYPKLAPITLDRVVIETPVILAPMSGVTDLPFRRLADNSFTGFRECNDGRSRAIAFFVRNHLWFAAFHDGHARVRGS